MMIEFACLTLSRDLSVKSPYLALPRSFVSHTLARGTWHVLKRVFAAPSIAFSNHR